MRIVKPDTAFKPSKKTKPVKRKDYLAWIHELPCMRCAHSPVEAAHLSWELSEYGHLGRGKGRKASDRWTLPLCSDCHAIQHEMGEEKFWFTYDPHLACLVLWGLYSDLGEDATEMATELIMKRELG